MLLEVYPGIPIDTLTMTRTMKGRLFTINLEDGRHIIIGNHAQAFAQRHFRKVMAEHGITTTHRPTMQWDAFCISLMQKAKHGGG